jgi:hypothetical protein
MAHTPGPWTADGSNVYADNVVVAEANCALDGCDDTARLIASAPDLLAALRALVEQYGDPKYMPDAPGWAEARAAIAKAEGK